MSVYRLTSPHTDLVYIGATSQVLSQRLHRHKANYKLYVKHAFPWMSSFDIVKCGDVSIEPVDDVKCATEEELRKHEGFWQQKVPCVNRKINGRDRKKLDQAKYMRWKATRPNVECLCGGRFTFQNRWNHNATARHLEFCRQIGG